VAREHGEAREVEEVELPDVGGQTGQAQRLEDQEHREPDGEHA
jgi:hypothetical protein